VIPPGGLATAYLGLGSNLGDRAALITAALAELDAAGVQVRARAPLYETDPVTAEPQPIFLNGAARVETTLLPDALLALCLAIERALGRNRPPGVASPAPRPIDLDLLLHGDTIVDRPGLVLPHPRLLDRPFVRIPLADVALAGLLHPITGEALDRAAPHPGVRRLIAAP
jgi:2-amino-4-hydroxy-6-hydroxymethyldihydropteridine diphosphokinase